MNLDKNNLRLAVLIDADNTFKVIDTIDGLFEEISKFGEASIRRIYGDWTDNRLNRWKEILPKYAIQPIQQYANTKGKNSTDSALIIDAMDLLYTAPLDGFCIVSSDSDFTKLAVRLRESGKKVYGFGEDKTPDSLVNACNQFIDIGILSSVTNADISQPDKNNANLPKKTNQELSMDTKLVSHIRAAIDALSEDDGYAHMGEIKKHIIKNLPAFDSRKYGYTKFSDLIKAIGLFEIDAQKQRIKDKRKK
jgi:uncharacterized LabA/DUF88 family protein